MPGDRCRAVATIARCDDPREIGFFDRVRKPTLALARAVIATTKLSCQMRQLRGFNRGGFPSFRRCSMARKFRRRSKLLEQYPARIAAPPFWERHSRRDVRASCDVDSVCGCAVNAGMSELHRITVDPAVCGGRPCVRGLRVRVKDILDLLASGAGQDEILADFPYLEGGDIVAALEFAAAQMDHPVLRVA